MISAASEPGLDQILARLALRRRRAQQLPPAGARPVTLSGRVGGWITPRAQDAIAHLPGVVIEPEAVHLRSASPRGLNTLLRKAALALRDAGCIRAWRDELVDVVAEGKVLGRIERGAMRPLGLLTRAVHLNAWSPDGHLWVARRALDKTTDPGLWDTLAGGLVSAGEAPDTALLRETFEEAGLAAVAVADHSPLRTVLRMHRRLDDGYQVETVMLADCPLKAGAVPVNQDGEVVEFRCLPLDELWAQLTRGAFTLEAELCILDSLRYRLQGMSAAAAS